MKIITNHLGYEKTGFKKAILEIAPLDLPPDFQLLHAEFGTLLASGGAQSSGSVPHWNNWNFYEFDFSEVETMGPVFLRILIDDTSVDSEIFQIKENILVEDTLNDVIHYFKSQRCSDQIDRKDRHTGFYGLEKNAVDLSGGWYDASGDVSKYLSHLSYANDMNPQQTPIVVWNLAKAVDQIHHRDKLAETRAQEKLQAEATHGADFLLRCIQDNGAMVMTVFDKWSKDTQQREACSYSTQFGHKHSTWEAGFRQGGGVSIAALARVGRQNWRGEFTSNDYLEGAHKAYLHLKEKNTHYLDDITPNIIDDYCALLASCELYQANLVDMEEVFTWTQSILSKQTLNSNYPGSFVFREGDSKPFFHAAEAGLPYIALMEADKVLSETSLSDKIQGALAKAFEFELKITAETFNPFGYARQYVQGDDEEAHSTFFYPHKNPSGYWWQGENARLASLASAVWIYLSDYSVPDELLKNLNYFAASQLNWILGLNPYNMCMLQGHGRNNPKYEIAYPPTAGGICNGITGGYEDELGIDFAPLGLEGDQNWRWSEQWIPHAAWYLLAITSQSHYIQGTQE